jgi:hypothetical protein
MNPLAYTIRRAAGLLAAVALKAVFKLGRKGAQSGIDISAAAWGRRVVFENDKAEEVGLEKIKRAIVLIGEIDPTWISRIKRDARGILAIPMKGEDSMGRWCSDSRLIILDFKSLLELDLEWVAAVIVHEASHARHESRGIQYSENMRRRCEAMCTRAMLRILRKMKDSPGKQDAVCSCLEALGAAGGWFSDEQRAWGRMRALEGEGMLMTRSIWKKRALDSSRKLSLKNLEAAGIESFVEVRFQGAEGRVSKKGAIDQWDAIFCNAAFENLAGEPLRVVRCAWHLKNSFGEWEEIVPLGIDRPSFDYAATGAEIPEGGTLSFSQLLPSEAFAWGAKCSCVAVGEGGRVYGGERMVDPDFIIRRWSEADGRGEFLREGEDLNEESDARDGLNVIVRNLSADDVRRIGRARTIAGQLERDYGAQLIRAYKTVVQNSTGCRAKIVWFQSYEKLDNVWRGRNISGRILGPDDFARWFGEEGGVGDGWVGAGESVTCDFNWKIESGTGADLLWLYLAVSEKGEFLKGQVRLPEEVPIAVDDIRWHYP